MSPLLRSSLFTVAIVTGLAASGREARAQVTYVGTFAMTNGASIKCLTITQGSFPANNVVTDPWLAVPAQQWAFFLLPSGYYAIMNVQTTEFLDYAIDPFFGNHMVQSQWSAKPTQMWYLYPLGGHFYALVNLGTVTVLTDPNTTSTNGTAATLETWANKLDQWWYLSFLRK
jgi:hypothetical protein